ncbi:MAG: hypothetical protein ACYTGA_13770 [Planctomycetota bacterium]|jgi:hypothetical protein
MEVEYKTLSNNQLKEKCGLGSFARRSPAGPILRERPEMSWGSAAITGTGQGKKKGRAHGRAFGKCSFAGHCISVYSVHPAFNNQDA